MIRVFKLKLKMYFLLGQVYVAVLLLCGLGFYFFAPPEYLRLLPAIGLFYCLTGFVFNYALDRCRYHPDRLLVVFMVTRMAKLLLTIIFLAVSVKVFHVDKIPFVITLMCNYFLYTALEIYLYYRYSTWHSKRAALRNEKRKK